MAARHHDGTSTVTLVIVYLMILLPGIPPLSWLRLGTRATTRSWPLPSAPPTWVRRKGCISPSMPPPPSCTPRRWCLRQVRLSTLRHIELSTLRHTELSTLYHRTIHYPELVTNSKTIQNILSRECALYVVFTNVPDCELGGKPLSEFNFRGIPGSPGSLPARLPLAEGHKHVRCDFLDRGLLSRPNPLRLIFNPHPEWTEFRRCAVYLYILLFVNTHWRSHVTQSRTVVGYTGRSGLPTLSTFNPREPRRGRRLIVCFLDLRLFPINVWKGKLQPRLQFCNELCTLDGYISYISLAILFYFAWVRVCLSVCLFSTKVYDPVHKTRIWRYISSL